MLILIAVHNPYREDSVSHLDFSLLFSILLVDCYLINVVVEFVDCNLSIIFFSILYEFILLYFIDVYTIGLSANLFCWMLEGDINNRSH